MYMKIKPIFMSSVMISPFILLGGLFWNFTWWFWTLFRTVALIFRFPVMRPRNESEGQNIGLFWRFFIGYVSEMTLENKYGYPSIHPSIHPSNCLVTCLCLLSYYWAGYNETSRTVLNIVPHNRAVSDEALQRGQVGRVVRACCHW